MSHMPLSVLTALVFGPLALPGQSVPQAPGGRTPPAAWLTHCETEVGPAWCGHYRVYEDRDAGAGSQIPVYVVVLPALSANPQPDPVFFLHGGPGGAATEAIGGMSKVLADAWVDRDLVFVDQRGTGDSNPLDCAASSAEAPLQNYFRAFLDPDYVRQCLAGQRANVTLYTTPIAMDDLDEVRAALGYERINLFGASYGTRAGLVYLRRHAKHVRSAVFKGVAPTNMKNPLPFARAAQRGLEALFDACERDGQCQRAYPRFRQDWDAALARFERGPVTAHVRHPRTGKTERVTIPRGVFADAIRHLLYNVNGASRIPQIVHRAAEGDFDRFAQAELNQAMGYERLLSEGMFMTVTCSEDIQFIREDEIGPASDGTFLGDYRVRRQLAACELWGRGDVNESYLQPVRARTPVLLLSGRDDTATPFEGGEEVARHLPNATHVIIPNQSHGFANPNCEFKLITDFIKVAGPNTLDTSCVAETKRPSFVKDVS